MKKRIIFLLIPLVILIGSCAKITDPEITVIYYRYILTLPKDYTSSKTYPLILFLHGYHANVNSYDDYKTFGLGEYAEEHEDFPFIVVAPQTEEEYDVNVLWKLVKDIIKKYSVDTDRIYVTGFSMGGGWTYYLAATHSDSVAAIAPVAAEGNTNLAQYLKDMGVWIFHDKGDPLVSYESALDMYNALVELGCDVKITAYENNTHSGWYETYTNPDLYTWFLEHSLKDRQGGEN